jgi:hypothetical protein
MVTGDWSVGGLVGSGGSLYDGVWDKETSGQANSAGGIGLATAEMMDPDMLALNGFAHDSHWVLDAGRDYPRLAWEGTPGEVIGRPDLNWMTGQGTTEAPYVITAADQLLRVGRGWGLWDRQFVLEDDVDFASGAVPTQPLTQAVIPVFSGIFAGDGHTISHLVIDGVHDAGLFGVLEEGAEVHNLELGDVNVVASGSNVGALAGSNFGVVTNCSSTGAVTGTHQVGALLGHNEGSIASSYSTGTVVGAENVGGLAGSSGGSIISSYSTCEVTGTRNTGGLVGFSSGRIASSYGAGALSGDESVGGLAGGNSGNIIRCYSTAVVTGIPGNLGGLLGSNSGIVLHAVWDVDASGLLGSAGGVGLTTVQMMDEEMLGLNGFGNDPNWVLDAGWDYPRLAWEGTAGREIAEPDIDWMQGLGTAASPYLIETADQLILSGQASFLWERHFILGADIDLDPDLTESHVFAQAVIPMFLGVFDGNDHTVSNLVVGGEGDAGLFGRLLAGAEITRLGVEDVNVVGSDRVGALAGWNEGGCMTHCYSTGTVSGRSSTGGLVGSNAAYLAHCFSSVDCSADWDVGGLVGFNYGHMIGCFATGSVYGNNSVGGLAGNNEGPLTHCFSSGAVSGSGSDLGGLLGRNQGAVSNCYSTGSVAGGGRRIGGLVGRNSNSGRDQQIVNCLWDTETSGQAESAGGVGLTTVEMQDIQTYFDAGWDFVGETDHGTSDLWQMPQEGGYPVLAVFDGHAPQPLVGMGTSEEPYLVSDALDLGALIHYPLTAHYRLAGSLDLSGILWRAAPIPWFGGTFEGNRQSVICLTIDGGQSVGMFGTLASRAHVSNLEVADANVAGLRHVGALAGENRGHVEGCSSSGVITGKNSIGGLVGSNSGDMIDCDSSGIIAGARYVGGIVGGNSGEVTDCHSSAIVDGGDSVGGLIGDNGGSVIRGESTSVVRGVDSVGGLIGANYSAVVQSCSAGEVVATGDSGGGLVGDNWWGNVAECYSVAAVGGAWSVGGLAGSNGGDVTDCYSTGPVSGTGDLVGGLVGRPYRWGWYGYGSVPGTVRASFWDVETSGIAEGDTGIGKTTAEMQTGVTFLEAGWDFIGEADNGTEDIWWILEGQDYPRLWWELEAEDSTELGG